MKLFISHASEDKEDIARPLAYELIHRGFDVWYDEFSLKLGDSLRSSIDKGLYECDFGVVILSKNFFEKNWTIKELNGLIGKEIGFSKKFILPVRHKITHQEILERSIMVSDLFAVNTESGLEEVVRALERATSKNGYNIPVLQSETRKIARYFSQYLISVWGGAVQWTPELVAAFGNDGYVEENGAESESFKKVQKFRSELKALNIKELAFGTTKDGYSWSMLVEHDSATFINELLWDCLAYNQTQRNIATSRLTFRDDPFYETSDIFKK
jgi:hypothetical protein